jgi:adenylate cyclase class 2
MVSRTPNLEVEVKIKIEDPKALAKRLQLLGCRRMVDRTLEDNFLFDFTDRRLRSLGHLFRVRDFGGQGSLTFKGPSHRGELFKIREELEIEVGNTRTLIDILQRLGMELTFRYQKFRTCYASPSRRGSPLVLTIDETPIGNYLELEGTTKDILRMAKQLGFGSQSFITESYVNLFFKNPLSRTQPTMVFAGAKRKKKLQSRM